MALQYETVTINGKEVEFLNLGVTEVIPKNYLAPIDLKNFEMMDAQAVEDAEDLLDVFAVYVLKNGRLASDVYGGLITTVEDYAEKATSAKINSDAIGFLRDLTATVNDINERVAVLEETP